MALTYTVYEDNNGSGAYEGEITTTSRSFTEGQLVVVLRVVETHDTGSGTAITNSGTAQTWNSIAAVNATDYTDVRGWWCVMSTSQSMTININATGGSFPTAHSVAWTIVHGGQDGTTPVPAGKVSSGTDADGDYSVSITPTATGSCLWLVTGDWNNGTDTYAAAANCTKEASYAVSGAFAAGLFRPTTQPRADASAFTIGETDTTGKISYIAFEVVAAAGGSTYTPRSMLLGVG